MADHTKVKDPVLRHLMAMGAWDWDKKEGAELNQATRVMQFSTALVSRLLPRVLDLLKRSSDRITNVDDL